MSQLLSAAGIPCGHESVFDFRTPEAIAGLGHPDWRGYLADSSWQAVPFLDRFPYPTVLVVRNPLHMVNSYMDLGFFTEAELRNPVHQTLRPFVPEAYEQDTEQDSILCVWFALNVGALRHAEMLFRLEDFHATELERLLRWAGADRPEQAMSIMDQIKPVKNDFPNLRAAVNRRSDLCWSDFKNQNLVDGALAFAEMVGYRGLRS